MANQDDSAMWIAGGLAAVRAIALASSSRQPARQSFSDCLRAELLDKGLRLVAAELGRQQGSSVWVVTCEIPDGRLLRVEVPASGFPYGSPQQVATDVSHALAAA